MPLSGEFIDSVERVEKVVRVRGLLDLVMNLIEAERRRQDHDILSVFICTALRIARVVNTLEKRLWSLLSSKQDMLFVFREVFVQFLFCFVFCFWLWFPFCFCLLFFAFPCVYVLVYCFFPLLFDCFPLVLLAFACFPSFLIVFHCFSWFFIAFTVLAFSCFCLLFHGLSLLFFSVPCLFFYFDSSLLIVPSSFIFTDAISSACHMILNRQCCAHQQYVLHWLIDIQCFQSAANTKQSRLSQPQEIQEKKTKTKGPDNPTCVSLRICHIYRKQESKQILCCFQRLNSCYELVLSESCVRFICKMGVGGVVGDWL